MSTDLNLTATITAAGDLPPSDPTNANDGNVGTQTVRGSGVLEGGTYWSYWISDLGSAQRVATMNLLGGAGAAFNDDPNVYLGLWGSANGSAWTSVPYSASLTLNDHIDITLTTPTTYRYWRLGKKLVLSGLGFYSEFGFGTWEVYAIPPEPGLRIDWDGDGLDVGADDDVTAYVQRWSISRGSGAEITAAAQPGGMTLTLINTDDRFNPLNASGPLYGQLTDGVPIWLGVDTDGGFAGTAVRGLFGGRITDITPLPAAGATDSPTVEIVAEDCLGWYDRVPVSLGYAEGRSHDAFRQALLTATGETRYSLANEIHTMPVSNADGDLLPALEEINRANGTRHFCQPGDSAYDWYSYTTRNRFWRTDGTADASLNLADRAQTSGWRLSADTVINQQRATVTPISFTPNTYTVWQADKLPIEVSSRRTHVIWVDFDEYVADATLNITASGALTSVLTMFGNRAKVAITSVLPRTVTALSIEGRLARRLPTESYVADDTSSQAGTRGVRSGSDISGDVVGVLASARGIAEHVVWRHGTPQFRPSLTVTNWFPEMFELDLYDVISLTSAQLGMTDHLFEIVGLTLEGFRAGDVKHHTVTYVLQECRAQADPGWFVLDTSELDSIDQLHY